MVPNTFDFLFRGQRVNYMANGDQNKNYINMIVTFMDHWSRKLQILTIKTPKNGHINNIYFKNCYLYDHLKGFLLVKKLLFT
jgi:hypothetical protein